MSESSVVVSRPAPHVLQVAINRPEAKNAIDEKTRVALIDAITTGLNDTDVRALLLCGTNGIFCAGGDLASMRNMTEEAARTRMHSGHHLIKLLWHANIPVVVAMEKFAIGAGAGLALVADHIVAGENTRMSFPFLRLGLVPDWGATQSLIRKAGWGTAKRLVLERASLRGTELLDLGLVEQVVADDCVMDVATDKALEFSRLPRLALQQFKETMRRSTHNIDAALSAEEDDQTACFMSEEFEEGLSALEERRAPDFFRDSSDD